MSSTIVAVAPLALLSPPDRVPASPPASTRHQRLPLESLTWENFERLCHRLTAHDATVEYCERYGRQGDEQGGIDIFGRLSGGRYACLQAKRHKDYSPSELVGAVDLFLAGEWADRTDRFTMAVQASLRSTAMQKEIEKQADRLKKQKILFEALDGETLSERLRAHPRLIDDFFGRAWVEAFLGDEAAAALGKRLDGEAFAKVRDQLARVYTAHFHSVDPGTFVSLSEDEGRQPLTLLERFLQPDMLVREAERHDVRRDERKEGADGANVPVTSYVAEGQAVTTEPTTSPTLRANRLRRVPLQEWLGDGDRLVVQGDAGCGKSTLLRVIALDLLDGQDHFPDLAARWGQHIPLYVPFARWTAEVTRINGPVGIKDIIKRTVEHYLTTSMTDLIDRAIDDRRVLLLVDGLDEWSSEQAARTTLATLVTTAEAHDMPVVVSGRPLGLARIGSIPSSWKRGTVAPLSVAQQGIISGRWFNRYVGKPAPVDDPGVSEGAIRTARFVAELARDANLGTIASVPLLLIGLITLALRGHILPRTRGEVYNELVRLLLEVHPDSRATAAGDTAPRFKHAKDADERRAAVARLAFAIRSDGGGAGMQTTIARGILAEFLASSEGFDRPEGEAAEAAKEILSVNAETQGLLIEKAHGHVGFVHASFEEYLGAEYLSRTSFEGIVSFVTEHASDGRWRNVIANLLSFHITRRPELDTLIKIIEAPAEDEVGQFQRQALLGDVAFGAAGWAASTARNLVLQTIQTVESSDWLPARREALASILKGLPDPSGNPMVVGRIAAWLPSRLGYRGGLLEELGHWDATPQLQELLFRAMHDEDTTVQRAAANSYARLFSSSAEAGQRLIAALASTRDLSAAAAFLESLAHGWAALPEAQVLFNEAWTQHNGDLKLAGMLGLLVNGRATPDMRDSLVRAQSYFSNVSHAFRELAVTLLLKYWPNDPGLIRQALARAKGEFNGLWEHDTAVMYLLEASTDRKNVRAWVRRQFREKYPFHIFHHQRLWSNVGRFAVAHKDVREAANKFWAKSDGPHIYQIRGYVAQVPDPAVADVLVGILKDVNKRFARYWALLALLDGWGADYKRIRPAIDALLAGPDKHLQDIAALLPRVMDKKAARARLIRMSSDASLRRDTLAIGLQGCGCDGTDIEAVAALGVSRQLIEDMGESSGTIFKAFGTHASVRAAARDVLTSANPPFLAIASAYRNDSEFAEAILTAAVPLPVELRSQIVEFAAGGASGTVLEKALAEGMAETDAELRVRMVVAHHKNLPPASVERAKQVLLKDILGVGPEYPIVRAAALAGIATIGALDALVPLTDRGKPVLLETAGHFLPTVAVERLVCERFAEFEKAFGDTLAARFASTTSQDRLPEILSSAPGASPAARAAFLALAEQGKIPLSIRATRALATESPRSELLLRQCWRMLEAKAHDREMFTSVTGEILRDHFPSDTKVRTRLAATLKKDPSRGAALALATYDPFAPELSYTLDKAVLGDDLGAWTVAVSLASARATTKEFLELLEAMLCLPWWIHFDNQAPANRAVLERLQRDGDLGALMAGRIEPSTDASVSGSFARYLAASSMLSADPRQRALGLLRATGTNQRLPVGGYDALSGQWRSLRATLLDAVSAGVEVG